MTEPTTGAVADVDRIAVLRANALGDFLFTLPALEALRAAYPSAELVLLGAPWHARWLADRPSPHSCMNRAALSAPSAVDRTGEVGRIVGDHTDRPTFEARRAR